MERSDAIAAPNIPAGLSVRHNGVWSLLGNGGFAACQLGMLVVMARLGTPELVGQYALGLAIASPVFMLLNLQLRTLLASQVGDDADLSVYITVRLLTTAAATAIAVAIGWQLLAPATALIVAAIGLSKAIDSLHDLVYGFYWRRSRMDYIAKSMLVRGVVGLAAFAIAFQFTHSVVAAVLAMCGTWLVVLALYDAPAAQRLAPVYAPSWWKPGWSPVMARRLLWLGLPAGALSWLVSLQVYVPRYFVQHELGDAALGIFAALAAIFIGLEMVARSFNYAAIPRLAQFAAGQEHAPLHRMVRQLTGFGLVMAVALAIGAVLLGRPLITFVFGATYGAHSGIFSLLTLGYAIRIATMPTAMTLRAISAYWSLVSAQLLAIGALAVACAALVPVHGLAGCAIACTIGFAVDGAVRTALHYWHLVRMPRLACPAAADVLQAA